MEPQRFRIVNDLVRARAANLVAKLPLEPIMMVEVRPFKNKRSLAQNALMWMWFTKVRDHLWETTGQRYTKDNIHDWFVDEFLPTTAVEINGHIKPSQVGTSKLNTVQMTEFLNNVEYFCGSELDLNLPQPAELYYEAMTKRAR